MTDVRVYQGLHQKSVSALDEEDTLLVLENATYKAREDEHLERELGDDEVIEEIQSHAGSGTVITRGGDEIEILDPRQSRTLDSVIVGSGYQHVTNLWVDSGRLCLTHWPQDDRGE